MSFLDNLENSLKTLESREDAAQRDKDERERRNLDQARALAEAPWADLLRTGPFTAALLDHATRIGHSQRTKVHIAWMGTTLRLEARGRRLELKPEPDGVVAVFLEEGKETSRQTVNLEGDASQLARQWLEAPRTEE